MDVHAFAFNEPGARLELFTDPLEPLQEAGVVREALLATSIDPNGTALHRLRLFLHCGKARSLDLVLPAGMSVVRVRRDSTDVAPIESGTSLSIPLPGASQGSKFCTIILDYVVADEVRSKSGLIRAVLPGVSFPSLSFTWELVAPSRFQAVDCGPGLVAVDGERLVSWRTGGVELWKRAWDLLRGQPSRVRRGDQLARPAARRVDRRRADVRGMVCPLGFGTARDRRPALAQQGWPWAEVGVQPQPPDREASEHFARDPRTTRPGHGGASERALLLRPRTRCRDSTSRSRYSGVVAERLSGVRIEAIDFSRCRAGGANRHRGRLPWEATKASSESSFWKDGPPRDLQRRAGPEVDRVSLFDRWWRHVVSMWWIAAVLLVAWLSFRRRFERLSRPYLGLVVLGIAALLLDWLLPTRYATYAGGVSGGGLLILIVELSLSLGLRRSRRRRTESSLVRRATGAALATGLLGLLLGGRLPVSRRSGPMVAVRRLFCFLMKGLIPPGPPRTQSFGWRISTGFLAWRKPRMWPEGGVCERSGRRITSGEKRAGRSSSKPSLSRRRGRALDLATARLRPSDIEKVRPAEDSLSIEPGGQFGEVAIPRSGNHVLTVRRSFATKTTRTRRSRSIGGGGRSAGWTGCCCATCGSTIPGSACWRSSRCRRS